MFQLDKQDVKLAHVNPRKEFAGDDTRLASDMKFEMEVPNTFLDMFDTNLRELIYCAPPADEQDLVDQVTDESELALTHLRFNEFKKIDWGYKGAGYRLVMNHQCSDEELIILLDITLDKFSFTFKNGGSVLITFKAIGHPTEEETGKLCAMMQTSVDLTLQPPGTF